MLFRILKPSAQDKRRRHPEGSLALAEALERYLQYLEVLSQATAPDELPRMQQDGRPAQVTFAAHSATWVYVSPPGGIPGGHPWECFLNPQQHLSVFLLCPIQAGGRNGEGCRRMQGSVPQSLQGDTPRPAVAAQPPSMLSPSVFPAALGAGPHEVFHGTVPELQTLPSTLQTGRWEAAQSPGPTLWGRTQHSSRHSTAGRMAGTLNLAGTR